MKLWLIIVLALEPLCKFQMLIQMTAELELEIALIIQSLDMRIISLKIYVFLSTFLTKEEVTEY